MRTVPIVLCIDVEPDERETDPFRPVDWKGFEAALECMDALRPRLAQHTGAPVCISWFLRMDPQVEQTLRQRIVGRRALPEAFARRDRSGDELGLHVTLGSGGPSAAAGLSTTAIRPGSTIACNWPSTPITELSGDPAVRFASATAG
ncbi:MAG: hypothetical protein H0U56_10945 [Methylibium sp.]|uniref:hypothetical protein n=1 Tax=Methylibium sp. TaxID=2067992 RepID=UPI0017F53DCC|nr:hypothetical protein [Methylibium sp.]MBA2723389.1 hypothetical protein [Methylibium sp.]MBA3588607.1 hypothetical protein [Methylibium sp.]